jgi:hypothetical protein
VTRIVLVCLFLVSCCAYAEPPVPLPPGAPLASRQSRPAVVQGSDWTSCKYVHPLDGKEYRGYVRIASATARRSENSSLTKHTLRFDDTGRLEIQEADDGWPDVTFELLQGKSPDHALEFRGRPELTALISGQASNKRMDTIKVRTSYEIRVGRVSYFDLNGDGVIDCWVDCSRDESPSVIERRSFIMFEGRVLEVEYFVTPFPKLLERNDPPVSAPMLAVIPMAWADERKNRYDFIDGKWSAENRQSLPQTPGNKSLVPPEHPKLRQLGREWIKVKTVHATAPGDPTAPPITEERTSYVRPGANVSYRKQDDDKTRHTLMLDHGGGLDVYEHDDKSALTVELIGKKPTDRMFYFNRQVSENGAPTRHELSFGPVSYFDLDGDGMIDCWVDHRGNGPKSFILFESQVVRVEHSNSPFQKVTAIRPLVWGEGRQVQYEFHGGKWSATKR